MKINYNKLSYILSCILCASLLLTGIYYFLFGTTETVTASVFDVPANAKPAENLLPTEKTVADTSSVNSATDSTAQVSAKTTVKGKITEKYISPYTANTNYENVYLKNNTELVINIKELLNSKLKYTVGKTKAPKVLILHTHATETYLTKDKEYYTSSDKERTTDKSENMVAIGNTVADILNKSGIKTLHDTTLHDYPEYNQSYSRAANTICAYLKKYPSLKVVIDLHRDSVENDSEKVKLTKDIEGKSAAQLMLVMGSQSGDVKNFPNYKENLKLAVKIQSKIESLYPGLARSICLNSKNYNESLSLGSVLIEVGTDANTFEEANYSAVLLGNALSSLFENL